MGTGSPDAAKRFLCECLRKKKHELDTRTHSLTRRLVVAFFSSVESKFPGLILSDQGRSLYKAFVRFPFPSVRVRRANNDRVRRIVVAVCVSAWAARRSVRANARQIARPMLTMMRRAQLSPKLPSPKDTNKCATNASKQTSETHRRQNESVSCLSLSPQGPVQGDLYQLGGAFLISRGEGILYQHISSCIARRGCRVVVALH